MGVFLLGWLQKSKNQNLRYFLDEVFLFVLEWRVQMCFRRWRLWLFCSLERKWSGVLRFIESAVNVWCLHQTCENVKFSFLKTRCSTLLTLNKVPFVNVALKFGSNTSSKMYISSWSPFFFLGFFFFLMGDIFGWWLFDFLWWVVDTIFFEMY